MKGILGTHWLPDAFFLSLSFYMINSGNLALLIQSATFSNRQIRTTDTIYFADENDIEISSLLRNQLKENMRVSVGDLRIAGTSMSLSVREVYEEDLSILDRFAKFPLMHEGTGNWRKG